MRKKCLLSNLGAGLLFLALNSAAVADIAIIAHPTNPLSTLEIADARRLFLKQTSEFPDGSRATVAMLSKESDVRAAFVAEVLYMSNSQLKAYWAKYIFTGQNRPPRELDSEATMRKWVAATPGALGYLHVNEVDDSVKVLRTVASDIQR